MTLNFSPTKCLRIRIAADVLKSQMVFFSSGIEIDTKFGFSVFIEIYRWFFSIYIKRI